MADEGFEEWDADFLDQLVQAEELALSSTTPIQHHPRPPLPLPPPPLPPPPAASYFDISYSPPRVLSQRVKDNTKGFDQFSNGIGHSNSTVTSVPYVHDFQNAKEQEIERLKEQECLKLRTERDKKEEHLKYVFSPIEAKDSEIHCTKNASLEYEVHIQDHPGLSLGCQNANSSNDRVGSRINVACKAIGIQTDKAGESTHLTNKNNLSIPQPYPSKLLGIWEPPSGQKSGRNLVSKLFVACETDFRVLFGCLNSSLSFKTTVDSLADETLSDVALQDHLQPAHSAENVKVSHLYSMLTKTSNGMVKLEALLEALVDLCGLENVVIVYRSLRVMRMVLHHLFSTERKSDRSVLYSGTMSWLRDLPLGTTVQICMDLNVLKLEACFVRMTMRHPILAIVQLEQDYLVQKFFARRESGIMALECQFLV